MYTSFHNVSIAFLLGSSSGEINCSSVSPHRLAQIELKVSKYFLSILSSKKTEHQIDAV